MVGALLKGTVNFSPATTWLQAVVWLLYVVTMTVFYRLIHRSAADPAPRVPAGAAP